MKIVFSTYEDKVKDVDNVLCGAIGCINSATKRITFDLGFSARFCNICADDFIKKGIGFENTGSKKNSEALELVEQPLSNTTRSNESFQEDTQNGYTDTVCDLIFILFTGLLILS